MRQAETSIAGNGRARTMWLAWLIVGTLDITAAVIQTLINGRNPLMMLKFIASGVFGSDALAGGNGYAVLGLLFHYMIAGIWTWLFFQLYPRLRFLQENVWVTTIVYGLFVWFVMNRIVLPLSNTPSIPFTVKGALISATILIFAIGMPLAMMARRHAWSR
ncbi:hypothetical protein WBG78_22105 [Chryseolinea sp. T2]|uniref:hypothetical protein n=1 Tax=Chryseolinea sp. T2 TaxID=3129255 RepID=UPI0030788E68